MRFLLVSFFLFALPLINYAQSLEREVVTQSLRKAAEFYREKVAKEGGYHFSYAEDLSYGRSEHGEGLSQVEVQREGTPLVGLAYLSAYEATGDRYYLEAARATAIALVKGQLCSGGWDYLIEFDPAKRARYPYRADGKCNGSTPKTPETPPTTLDDNVTQACVRLLMRVDLALGFTDQLIHEAVQFALAQLSKAQYPNGAWPQRYHEFPDPAKFPVKRASYPETWPRKWPGANYQTFYTFNDNTISDAIDLFLEAARIYNEPRYRAVAEKGGEFILLAQMPEPQPAWAQQYDLEMHPAWARLFEPPSVTGGESQGIIKTLLVLYRETGNKKYLEPAKRALAYLRRSILPPVQNPSEARARLPKGAPALARFYELKTNKPLYITKGTQINLPGRPTLRPNGYELSYSDESVIRHYAVLISGAELDAIEAEINAVSSADVASLRRPDKLRGLSPWSVLPSARTAAPANEQRINRILSQRDERGAWVELGSIGRAGQVVSVFAAKDMTLKIGDRIIPVKENETVELYEGAERPRERIIRSTTFASNVEAMCAWLLVQSKSSATHSAEHSVFMIGDSTMADKLLNDNPERGWGQLLPTFFTDQIVVKNHAMNGRSTKSFIDEGRWATVLNQLQKDDWVFIQFGHNDEKKEDPKRYAAPNTDYKTNLARFVNEARSKGAAPILLTPVMRRRFDANGKFFDTHGEYPDAVRALAKELNIPLIDMHASSQKLIEQFGVEESKKLFLHIAPGAYKSLPQGKQDDTHFSEFGATQMAGLVVAELRQQKLGIAQYLK
ncbi:MAG: hypothetical protein JST84_33890 [Acidobacteria bacterium]|nr:hypothetical protein [Acidobacteriota bacterium]